MIAGVPLVILISAVVIVLIMLAAVMGLFQLSLGDYTDREDWDEVIFYALLAVVALIILSFVNLGIPGGSIAISLNFTGVIVPAGIVIFLLATRRLKVHRALVSMGIVALVAYPLTQVNDGGAFIQFPFWLIPAGVAAACGLLFTKNMDGERAMIRGGAIAYAAGCLGMLMGGDLLHLPELLNAGGSSLVLGARGILDFVFLTGVVAIFIVWTVQAGKPLIRRYLFAREKSDTTS